MPVFLLFSTLLMSIHVNAWGPLGHQTICEVAWQESHSTVRRYLASAAKRMGYRTFAESCVWADHIRSDPSYHYLKPMHYINVPRSSSSVADAACLKQYQKNNDPRCVVAAIMAYQQRVANHSLSQRQQDEALLLLAHFIGDVHQPLHVSYADDLGGNRRRVIFEGKLLNLHALWDSELLYCQYYGSWRKLGKKLIKSPRNVRTIDDVTTMLDAHVLDWADESLSLTRQIYQHLPKRLPDHYCDTYHPLALERLYLAGTRLAHVLSDAF